MIMHRAVVIVRTGPGIGRLMLWTGHGFRWVLILQENGMPLQSCRLRVWSPAITCFTLTFSTVPVREQALRMYIISRLPRRNRGWHKRITTQAGPAHGPAFFALKTLPDMVGLENR